MRKSPQGLTTWRCILGALKCEWEPATQEKSLSRIWGRCLFSKILPFTPHQPLRSVISSEVSISKCRHRVPQAWLLYQSSLPRHLLLLPDDFRSGGECWPECGRRIRQCQSRHQWIQLQLRFQRLLFVREGLSELDKLTPSSSLAPAISEWAGLLSRRVASPWNSSYKCPLLRPELRS